MSTAAHDASPFYAAFRGHFWGIRSWEQLDTFWEHLRADADGDWYLYAIGEPPPDSPVSGEQMRRFIEEIDKLLRDEHDEDYCGIVYADDREQPSFVKIFDPNNLGTSCGSSEIPPLPGWVLSKLPPIDLPSALPQPGNRRRWWRRLFGG